MELGFRVWGLSLGIFTWVVFRFVVCFEKSVYFFLSLEFWVMGVGMFCLSVWCFLFGFIVGVGWGEGIMLFGVL